MTTEKLDTQQAVELAEGVEIRLRVAGPMLRAGAYALDLLIRGVVMIVASIGMGLLGIAIGQRLVTGALLLAWFLLEWFYPVLFEAGKRGATPGKRILGLRVVQATGSPITAGQAIVRNFLRWVDGMPFFTYGCGMASCLATRRFQRLGDLAAGTVVIYERVTPSPALAAPPPITPVPLPVGLSADETRALVRFRERAGLWSAARREEIADQASALSGASGAPGVSRLMAMAHWVQDKKQSAGAGGRNGDQPNKK
ncbi:MAG: RDD family protein [Verrucomicrobiota bacterium]